MNVTLSPDVIDEFKQSMKVNIAKHITERKFP